MDVIKVFFNQLNGVRPSYIKALTRDEQKRIFERLRAVRAAVPGQQLAVDKRQELLGKRQLSLPALVSRCADGLARFPQIAADLQLQPQGLRTLANQDLNLGGLIKILEVLHQGAQDRGLECGQRTDALVRTARDAVVAAIQAPTATTGLRQELGGLFEEPIRMAQEVAAEQTRSADRYDRALQPMQDEMSALKEAPVTEREVEELDALAHASAPTPTAKKAAAPKTQTPH